MNEETPALKAYRITREVLKNGMILQGPTELHRVVQHAILSGSEFMNLEHEVQNAGIVSGVASAAMDHCKDRGLLSSPSEVADA